LNEGGLNKFQAKKPQELGLHFWRLPRYLHDEGFLTRINEYGSNNDGFALMVEWRKQFLLRKKTGQWGDFPKPKQKTRAPGEWRQYAERTRIKLKGAVGELGLSGL
jgi:hypothetical protein